MATKHGISRLALFHIMSLTARITKVDPLFINRFKFIYFNDRSYNNALRFISFYICLNLNRTIPGYSYNLVSQLKTEEEKSETLILIDKALKKNACFKKIEPASIQKIRLLSEAQKNSEISSLIKDIVSMHSSEANIEGNKSSEILMSGSKALSEIKFIFDQNGKRFFLVSGTLLGAIRDKKFVCNDNDIDIGVFSDEITKPQLRRMLCDTEFYLDRDYEYELSYLSKNNVRIDIFMWERAEDHYLTRSFGGAHEYRWTPFQLIEHKFLGDNYLIPKEYALILEENYGNWNDKVAFFDWAFDVPSSQYGDKTEAILFLMNRFRDAIDRNDRYIASKAANDLYKYFDIDIRTNFPTSNWKW